MLKTSIAPSSLEHLSSQIVPADAKVSTISTFADWTWDFRDQAKVRSHEGPMVLDWIGALGESFCLKTHPALAISLKEFAYARLFNPTERLIAIEPRSMKSEIVLFKPFCQWLEEQDIESPAQLDGASIHQFLGWLKNTYNSKSYNGGRLSIDRMSQVFTTLRSYYKFRNRVSCPLLVNPFSGKSLYKVLGVANPVWSECRTDTIPIEVLRPYCKAAFDYIDHFAADILAARTIIDEIRKEVQERVRTGTLKESSMALTILRKSKAALNEYLLSLYPGTGKPWRDGWNSNKQFLQDESALQIACFIVTLFLSGMRESEVLALKINGHIKDMSADGVKTQYLLKSRLSKKSDKKQTWVVNESIYRALEINKLLYREAREQAQLLDAFILGGNSCGSNYQKLTCLKVRPYGTTRRRLNWFANYIKKQWPDRYDIPDVDGKTWVFNNMQFRRTLAHRIAREPFGMIAGMLQYKHVQISTFEGYAGSDPSWKKMLEEERALASVDSMNDMFFDLEDGAVAGVKGEQLLADFQGTASDRTKGDIEYYLRNSRIDLHVGLLNYCFFDPSLAVCLKDRQDKEAPILNHCSPDKCPNSCIGKKHLPVWSAHLDDVRVMLKTSRLSQPQRIILESEFASAEKIVSKLSKGNGHVEG